MDAASARRPRRLAGDETFAVEEARDDTPGGDVGREQSDCEPDSDRDGGLDELEGDEGCEAEERKAGDGRELLGDADVACAGGDSDADPDRPECEERGEEELGEQLRRMEDDGSD